jgi:hypothetical protein
MKGFIYFEV